MAITKQSDAAISLSVINIGVREILYSAQSVTVLLIFHTLKAFKIVKWFANHRSLKIISLGVLKNPQTLLLTNPSSSLSIWNVPTRCYVLFFNACFGRINATLPQILTANYTPMFVNVCFLFIKITVTPAIGNTCGLCQLNGVQSERFRTPSGSSAKNLVSFAQSWVVADAEDGGKWPVILVLISHCA